MIKSRCILILLCLLSMRSLHAQVEHPMTNPFYDESLLHWGFYLGGHFQDAGKYQPNYMPGFNVGLVGSVKLNRYFSLRLTPGILFGEKEFSVEVPNERTYNIPVKSYYVTVPLGIKYAAKRFNDVRPYVYFGGTVAFDLAGKSDDLTVMSDGTLLHYGIDLKRTNYMLDFAIGCDIYFEYFKLVPELRFSLGLNDVLESYRPLSLAIPSVNSNMISLIFYFE